MDKEKLKEVEVPNYTQALEFINSLKTQGAVQHEYSLWQRPFNSKYTIYNPDNDLELIGEKNIMRLQPYATLMATKRFEYDNLHTFNRVLFSVGNEGWLTNDCNILHFIANSREYRCEIKTTKTMTLYNGNPHWVCTLKGESSKDFWEGSGFRGNNTFNSNSSETINTRGYEIKVAQDIEKIKIEIIFPDRVIAFSQNFLPQYSILDHFGEIKETILAGNPQYTDLMGFSCTDMDI